NKDIKIDFGIDGDVIESIIATNFEEEIVEGVTVAKAEDEKTNSLVISDEHGNDIGSVLVVTESEASFDENTTTMAFTEGTEDFSDTVDVSVLDNDDKVIGNTSFNVEISSN